MKKLKELHQIYVRKFLEVLVDFFSQSSSEWLNIDKNMFNKSAKIRQ